MAEGGKERLGSYSRNPYPLPRRNTVFPPQDETLFAVKQRKPIPHEFVLDAVASLSPRTRSMFGCLAIYVQDKIVLILRDKPDQTAQTTGCGSPPPMSII